MKFFKKRKKLKIFLLVVLVLGLTGGIVANQVVKRKGYRNLWHFVTTVGGNYKKSFSAEYEKLEIKISKADYKKLKKIRDAAMERGVLIKESDAFVEAELKHKGKKIKAKLRLKGHMTDHLEGKKWSFRIVTKKGDAFMGMKRFSIQHPGTRNYVYEWIFHQMMKQEGIIALRYDFIDVKLNGDDLGIYALEEHFAQELIENNERVKGPIIRFNPELYWSFRLAELNRTKIIQAYADMQAAQVEAYDDNNTYEDSTLLNRYAQAVILMEGFRRGKLKTSEVFDMPKMARYHAIVDVVGGHHSLDWSDIKYYYNAKTNLLEPVAYESFSIRNTDKLSGSFKCTGITQPYITDLHAALFNDPVFFKVYITELQRIASDKWLKAFLKKIDKPLQNKLATIYGEFPYKEYSDKDYYKNISNIKAILSPTQGLHAYVNGVGKGTVSLGIGGIDALPCEVTALQVDSVTIPVLPRIMVPARGNNAYVHYTSHIINVNPALTATLTSESKLTVVYNLLGKKETKQAKVTPVAAYTDSLLLVRAQVHQPNPAAFNFISVNEASKEMRFAPGKHVLAQNLVLPAGYKVLAGEGTVLDLTKGARIISYSPVFFTGTEDSPVELRSSDSSGQGLELVSTASNSVLEYVYFTNLGITQHASAFSLYEAGALISNCAFIACYKAADIDRCMVKMSNTVIEGTVKQGIEGHYINLTMTNCLLRKIKKDGLVLTGAIANITSTRFQKIKSTAIVAKEGTQFKGSGIKLEDVGQGVEARDAAKVSITGISIAGCGLAFKSHKKGDVFGPASISIKKLTQKNIKTLSEAEKKSTIKISK